MNRGSHAPMATATTPATSFNEAPIHESGKSCQSALRMHDAVGFNEAPIHESGKSDRKDTNMNRNSLLQ